MHTISKQKKEDITISLRMTENEFKEFLSSRNLCVRGTPQQKRKGKTKNEFQSLAEQRYYEFYIQPMLAAKKLERWTMHESFVVLDSFSYKGKKYRKRIYTPDFMLYFSDGKVKAVEIKGTKIKKLQREYPLKKQLFIQRYCLPNDWEFEEIVAEDLTK